MSEVNTFAARGLAWLILLALLLGCEPLHDLDNASSGVGQSASSPGPEATDQGSSTGTPAANAPAAAVTVPTALVTGTNEPSATAVPTTPAPSSGTGDPPAPDPAPLPTASAPATTEPHDGGGAGGTVGSTAPTSSEPASSGSGGSPDPVPPASGGTQGADAGGPVLPPGDAPELPIDLPSNPVSGTFTVSSEAEWEVDGVFIPTFEIHTPSASYWLVKALGMIVSVVDSNTDDDRQWIDFSSGFRPLRGLPSFGTFGEMGPMTTTLDEESQTPTHLRLFSSSNSGDWKLVYDFYPTHVTLTINAAPTPFGIAYRGVPGGLLEDSDQFVLADGTAQGALLSSVSDLPGPAEWAYVSDPTLGRSMFFIQHQDDELTDRYQVRDNDSSMFSFGDGMLSALPLRFSFGLIESSSHQAVATRAAFIIDAIQ